MTRDRKVWEVVEFVGEPLGHFEASVTASTLLPSLPSDANRAVIRSKAVLYWTDDGTTPTASHGMYLAADDSLVYDGTLSAFRMFAPSAADVRVAYYAR